MTFGPKHHSETVRSAQNIILCCGLVGAKLMYLANAGVGLREDLGILRRVCNRQTRNSYHDKHCKWPSSEKDESDLETSVVWGGCFLHSCVVRTSTPVLAVLSMCRNTTQRADTQFLQVARQEYRVDRRRLHHFAWFAKGPVLDFRLWDCQGHDLLIAVDSDRTVGQGEKIFISSSVSFTGTSVSL